MNSISRLFLVGILKPFYFQTKEVQVIINGEKERKRHDEKLPSQKFVSFLIVDETKQNKINRLQFLHKDPH